MSSSIPKLHVYIIIQLKKKKTGIPPKFPSPEDLSQQGHGNSNTSSVKEGPFFPPPSKAAEASPDMSR